MSGCHRRRLAVAIHLLPRSRFFAVQVATTILMFVETSGSTEAQQTRSSYKAMSDPSCMASEYMPAQRSMPLDGDSSGTKFTPVTLVLSHIARTSGSILASSSGGLPLGYRNVVSHAGFPSTKPSL